MGYALPHLLMFATYVACVGVPEGGSRHEQYIRSSPAQCPDQASVRLFGQVGALPGPDGRTCRHGMRMRSRVAGGRSSIWASLPSPTTPGPTCCTPVRPARCASWRDAPTDGALLSAPTQVLTQACRRVSVQWAVDFSRSPLMLPSLFLAALRLPPWWLLVAAAAMVRRGCRRPAARRPPWGPHCQWLPAWNGGRHWRGN
jgi:hypothetical protein